MEFNTWHMEIIKKADINKNIDEVWQVLGHDFAHPHKWASSVHHSEGYGEPVASISCNQRSCDTAIGSIKERLKHFSESDYSLSIDIVEGLPIPMKTGGSAWKLSKLSDEMTLLTFKVEFHFKAWAFMLKPLMKRKLGKMARELTEDFVFYVENGIPHPRKATLEKNNSPSKKSNLSLFYLFSFFVGTFVPLYFIFSFILQNGGMDLSLFVSELFSNNASSTFSSDLLISSFIFWGFMTFDKKGKNIPHVLLFIGLNLSIGLSSALPLYLYFREENRKV